MRSGRLPILAVILVLAVACTGDGMSPSPDSTPSPAAESPTPAMTPTAIGSPTVIGTSTVTGETGDLDGFRAFAPQIADAVAEGATAFFADRALVSEIVCAGDEESGACLGQAKGTVMRGIPGAVAESDAVSLFPLAEYPAVLRDWFTSASPDGSPTLWAIAHRPAGGGKDDAYQAVVTAVIVVGPAGSTVLRQQGRVFDFQFADGRWRLSGELYASLPETIRPWRYDGCSDCYDHWERWQQATR